MCEKLDGEKLSNFWSVVKFAKFSLHIVATICILLQWKEINFCNFLECSRLLSLIAELCWLEYIK